MYDEECKRCSLFDRKFFPACHIFNIKDITKICPCSTCVIKPVCTEMCSKRGSIFDKVRSENVKKIEQAKVRYESTKLRR
ncbi:MAG: hypothetical protein ACFFG0_03890 [Candidatus Thorarchaeota archaeon]